MGDLLWCLPVLVFVHRNALSRVKRDAIDGCMRTDEKKPPSHPVCIATTLSWQAAREAHFHLMMAGKTDKQIKEKTKAQEEFLVRTHARTHVKRDTRRATTKVLLATPIDTTANACKAIGERSRN